MNKREQIRPPPKKKDGQSSGIQKKTMKEKRKLAFKRESDCQ
jgi:hypothetical protein